jgi:hypothetical protein
MKLVPHEPVLAGLPLNQVYHIEIKMQDYPSFSCRVPLTVHIDALVTKAKDKWQQDDDYDAFCGKRKIELHPEHTLHHYGLGPGDTVELRRRSVKVADDMDEEDEKHKEENVATVLGERPQSSDGAHVLPWQILDLNAVQRRWAIATAQLVLQETGGDRFAPGQHDAKTVYDKLIERGQIGAAFTLLFQLRHFSAHPLDYSDAATPLQLIDLLRRIAPFVLSNPNRDSFRSPRTNRWYSGQAEHCDVEAWASMDWIFERMYDTNRECASMVEGVQCLLHLDRLLPIEQSPIVRFRDKLFNFCKVLCSCHDLGICCTQFV